MRLTQAALVGSRGIRRVALAAVLVAVALVSSGCSFGYYGGSGALSCGSISIGYGCSGGGGYGGGYVHGGYVHGGYVHGGYVHGGYVHGGGGRCHR